MKKGHHRIMDRHGLTRWICLAVLLCTAVLTAGAQAQDPAPLREMLDAPLLFVKRHSYKGIHIYDTYYKWGPGGGIYVLENPWDPPEQHRIRPVIDADTPETLGGGVYSDPDLSYDGTRLLFCHKPEQEGSTSIYEIGVDGTGLRRITDPCACMKSQGAHGAQQHDVSPAYMPDGRIIFTSTRPNGLVPCANSGVDILHMMNGDGSDIRRVSVNNVNEFDPCVLPDGRILHGRWEYVDKNALTIQSLWTIFPDGTNETAVFANNMARPEALLDARPVPGAPHLIATVFTPHNAPPRGSIAIVDTRLGKNGIAPITNFENKEDPAYDRGNSCEPWPLSEDVILFSGRPEGFERNVIELIHRDGWRELLQEDPDICCHSPIPLKPRPEPDSLTESVAPEETSGRFYVQDIYRGLTGVERGEVKWLRVIEETSRTSATPGGAYNQTFLISAALAFSAKNFLGLVPVEPDGSAHFEVPAGRALFLQALDEDGRLIQSMRTFVQAAPGVTRSCIGCHERKFDAPSNQRIRQAHRKEPVQPVPESWGTGYLDYPGMVQPVLDKHCVSCHGGEKGFAAGLDLTGGWTEHFSNSYENLASRRESQLTATLIAGIDCMNGTALWSSPMFPPRGHGSGAAPLAEVLVSGHKGRIPNLTRRERDLMLAWIDTNGVYHGTWDYSEHGCQIKAWGQVRDALTAEMRAADCMRCHETDGRAQFEGDWFNLERPELSRILRAPLAKGSGLGLGLCQDKKTSPRRQRIRLLVGGNYAHGILPIEMFEEQGAQPPRDGSVATPVATFASTEDPHYQAMLRIIRQGRRDALATPRVDMPGAVVVAGHSRQFIPPPLPDPLPSLKVDVDSESAVHLSWERSARTIGLIAEIHRGTAPDFAPTADTLLSETRGFEHLDISPSQGEQHYALVLRSGYEESESIRTAVVVPNPPAPSEPAGLKATAAVGGVDLAWEERAASPLRYHVYRAADGTQDFERVTLEPTTKLRFVDTTATPEVTYAYMVRAVSRRGVESGAVPAVTAAALPELREPVFVAAFADGIDANLYGGGDARGTAHGAACIGENALDLRQGGHVAYDHRPAFDLTHRVSVACRVKFAKDTDMPVVVSCGAWGGPGWFLQRLGGGWRWYVGGINCDGGRPTPGEWTHLVSTYDGETARLFQDGQLVAEVDGTANQAPWSGALHVGQYSAGPAPQYQVNGWIADVKVYNCAVNGEN
jgi:Hydrazine synthase alpha subunit middle domain/Concanavalin A-like lectin/glucanases superfamily/WD40-like Beta Propeller Repeat